MARCWLIIENWYSGLRLADHRGLLLGDCCLGICLPFGLAAQLRDVRGVRSRAGIV